MKNLKNAEVKYYMKVEEGVENVEIWIRSQKNLEKV